MESIWKGGMTACKSGASALQHQQDPKINLLVSHALLCLLCSVQVRPIPSTASSSAQSLFGVSYPPRFSLTLSVVLAWLID